MSNHSKRCKPEDHHKEGILNGINIQKDINRICQLLSNHLNTDESIKLSKILQDAEIIDHMYVSTYIHSLSKNLEGIKNEDLENLMEENQKLQLGQIIYNRTKLDAVKEILCNALDRKEKFCDFADSKFHSQTKIGACHCDYHGENIDWDSLSKEEQEKENHLKLFPVYRTDEETAKFIDSPDWYCQKCYEGLENADYDDCDVYPSCDMEEPF